MKMTSRFTLVVAVGGLTLSGCSSPAEDPGPPSLPPPLASNPQFGAAGTNAGTGGTTTTPPAAQGGTGGAPASTAGTGGSAIAAAAGAGGVAAAAGAGGAPSGIGTGTGNLITHDSTGWVAGTSNGVGIQGSFYPYGDFTQTPMPGDTTVTVDPFAAATGTVCISGTASAVLGEDYTRYYGGGVGLNLADPGGMAGAGPWTRGSVTGFSFTVTGPTIPPNIRFNVVDSAGTTYCMDDIPTGAATQIQFGTLIADCYQAGGAPLPQAATLESIQWQIVTVVDTPTQFDFCIENLTALGAP
jgi:hypothetical protein